MKTRRALQIIVGVLSLLVVLCLLAAAVFVAIVTLFPDMSTVATELYQMFSKSFDVIANYIGLKGLAVLVPLLAYVLPGVLLLVAGVLMMLRDKGKQGKYVAANVLALIGSVIITVFTILFAADLVSRVNGDVHVWTVDTFSFTSMDTIVRIICAGVLALFVIFVGCALGIKPKKVATEEVATQEVATEEQSEETVAKEETHSPYETVAPGIVSQPTAGKDATEYVPNDASVEDVTNGVYSKREQLSTAAMEKIIKVRQLYEMGAVTEEEYVKLVNAYLQK